MLAEKITTESSMNRYSIAKIMALCQAAAIASSLVVCPAGHAQSVLRDIDAKAAFDQPEILTPNVPLDVAAVAAAMQPGDRTIRGAVFHRLNSAGGVVLLKIGRRKANPIPNAQIVLFPYSEHLMQYKQLVREKQKREARRRKPAEARPNPALFEYSRIGKTDEYGRFQFSGLKPGRYVVWIEGTKRFDHSETEIVEVGRREYAITGGAYSEPIFEQRERPVVSDVFIEGFQVIEIPASQPQVEIDVEMKRPILL